jgi:pimeloyl-ACP methyl ester carboxylesterase
MSVRIAGAVTDDGVTLSVEEVGSGTPILFIHEFAGNRSSWQPQVAHFASTHRCISYSARGYPPSEVPTSADSYSQMRAVADAVNVLDELSVDRAHLVGLSMGGFCALHLGLDHPDRVTSLVLASVGYGAAPERQDVFRRDCESMAALLDSEGPAAYAERYSTGPARVQLQAKDAAAWDGFRQLLASNSGPGMALTMRGVQMARPSLYDLSSTLQRVQIPTLLLVGAEDVEALEASAMLARTVPASQLVVLPNSGHTLNLEEPTVFNRLVDGFLNAAEP